MNNHNITKEFNAGHVGQLASRHEVIANARREQQSIPYTGLSYADERKQQQQRDNQPVNDDT